jgi:hypothetical protein
MDSRSSILSLALALVLVVGAAGSTAFAQTVYSYGGDFNLPIPAEPGNSRGWMQDAIIEIPDHFTIYDLDVRIDITHTSVFDLQLFLQGPFPARVCLNTYDLDEFLEGENYIHTIFDDEALIPIEQSVPPFTGRFNPRAGNLLRTFDGRDAFGLWRLQVYDKWLADTGALNSFNLIITVPEPATAILLAFGAGLIRLFNRPQS